MKRILFSLLAACFTALGCSAQPKGKVVYEPVRFEDGTPVEGDAEADSLFAQDRFWPEGQTAFDAQMSAIVERVWADRAAEGRPPFSVRFESDAALVGVGAPTHVFLPAVADMLSAPCVVPQHAPVANAVGAAVSRISVEQRVYVNPVRGADGVVQGYKVRGSGSAEMCDHLDEALEVARERAGTLAQEEARRRGASGELACNIEEHRRVFRATAIFEVDREWTVVARIGFDE